MSEKEFKDCASCSACGSTTYREIFKPSAMSDCVIVGEPIVIGYACTGCGKKIIDLEKEISEDEKAKNGLRRVKPFIFDKNAMPSQPLPGSPEFSRSLGRKKIGGEEIKY